MGVYEELLEYYKTNHKNLIFLKEIQLKDRAYCKLYSYVYDDEKENFSKLFNLYLPFYADSYNMIKHYIVNDVFLTKKSKEIWKNDITRKDVKTSGIFGELLLDFYTRIVNSNNILACYASKQIYSDKIEFKGIDCLGCSMRNNKLEIILSEAKFVGTLSSAKNDLINDINGNYGHLNIETINSYCGFAMKKIETLEKTYSSSIIKCLDKINLEIVSNNQRFIDIMNLLEYKFKFVYFAIFQSNYKTPDLMEKYYQEIIDTFNKNIGFTKINNYSIEIIFIPTNSSSTEIKNEMVKLYG